jgi:hypothetical protein
MKSIDLVSTPPSSIEFPTSSLIKKLFLDSSGVVSVMSFDGSVKPLEGSKPIPSAIVNLDALQQILYPLFDYLTELINLETELTDEKLGVVSSLINKFFEKQEDKISNLIEILNSNNEELKSNNKLTIDSLENKVSDFNVALDSLKISVEETITKLFNQQKSIEILNGQVTENKVTILSLNKSLLDSYSELNKKLDTKASVSDVKELEDKIPEEIKIVAGTNNVHIEKDKSTYSISVDLQEVTNIVNQGGGVSKKWVEKYVEGAVQGISPSDLSDYTLLSTTALLTGSLQDQIDGIVLDGITISSSSGNILISQVASDFNINVSDYISKSTVASISAGLDTRISNLDARFVNISGDTMTGNLSMSGAAIKLDPNFTPAHAEGTIFYDSQFKTLAYFNDNSDVTVNVGQESIVRVRNNTGSLIANGKVVCISGSSGSHPLIVLASNSSPTHSHSTLGVATHNISDNEDGYITTQGLVNGLNTSMFSAEGVTLWLSTSGDITETEPTAPTHKVKIGYLVRKHNTQGRILVSIDTGMDLKDLHDVSIGDYEDGALLVANGSVWSPGTNVNDLTLLTTTSLISSGFNTRIDNLEEIIEVTSEPRGFENRTDSSLSFNESTRTFTISGNYNIWNAGVKYPKTGETSTISNSTGSFFFYYNAAGVFTTSSPGVPWNLMTDVPIALVYWDAVTQKGILLEERHGIVMDSATHAYLHKTVGTRNVSIGLLSGLATIPESTTSISGQQFGIGSSIIADEDIESTLSAFVDGGTYTVVSKAGSGNDWRITSGRNLPFLVGATPYIAFNENVGGTWQVTELSTNNTFVNNYVVAVPAVSAAYQYVIVPGQATYSSLALAQAETVSNLNLVGIPFAELSFLYRVTYRYSTSAQVAATNRARIEGIASISFNNITTGVSSTPVHNALAGLQGGIAGEYFHLNSSEYSDLIGRTEVSSISGTLLNGISASLTYDISGNLSTYSTVKGSKIFSYSNGKLVSISGTGEYVSKLLSYSDGVLQSITVL